MLDFNTSLERYNSNGYRTPFIFILGSILRTGEQNEMSKARRLFGNRIDGRKVGHFLITIQKSFKLIINYS